MKTTAAQAVADALARYKTKYPDVRPTRVFLGPFAYEQMHKEARVAGVHAPMHPHTEDERLEHRGMRVYCHADAAITFEP